MINTLRFNDSSANPVLLYTGFYSDEDCTSANELHENINLSYTDPNTGNTYYYVYIKAQAQNDSENGAWNTDATGNSSGTTAQSSDRIGIHHETTPCLDFARALSESKTAAENNFILTDIWGKRLNNYSQRVELSTSAEPAYGSAASTYEVADKTGPVLWTVRTGQELHDDYNPSVGETSQHSYDGHNFIEFRYSEPVNFGSADPAVCDIDIPAYSSGTTPNIVENIQVTDSFGAIQGTSWNSQGDLSFAGLAKIWDSKLATGKQGSADKYVNALYRTDEYSLRLSVAGLTNGTVTDVNGFEYKKWIGYIDEAAQFEGKTVTFVSPQSKVNPLVYDINSNPQIEYLAAQTEPIIRADSTGLLAAPSINIYSRWDLSEPVFALLRNSDSVAWDSDIFQTVYQAEAIGNNAGTGSTLDRIEFHIFDNTPDFSASPFPQDQPEWFTETGWCIPGSEGSKETLYKPYSYSADIFGGSRPYSAAPGAASSNRTSGGVRYSTISNSAVAFTYGIGGNVSAAYINKQFDSSQPAFGGASSLIFTGTSVPRRSSTDLEGLYFALPLQDTSLDITTTFTIKYDESKGYITDYAGNRLRTKVFSTIDRSPPGFDMTVCPVGDDELAVIFVKELCIDSEILHFQDNTTGEHVEIAEDYATLITKCFDFIKIDSSGSSQKVTDLYIDSSVPARISVSTRDNGSSFTKMIFKLNRKITLDDIKTVSLRVTYHPSYGEVSVDFFTKHQNAKITFVQDYTGNSMPMYTAHALSDFAVGVINPLYAYDSSMTDEDDEIISDGLYHFDLSDPLTGFTDVSSWAVHDWNRDQQNYGTLPAERSLAIVADTDDGKEDSDTLLNFRIYLANNPDPASVSMQFNKDMEPNPLWRIWFPDVLGGVFTPLAERNNSNYMFFDGTELAEDHRLIFDIPKDKAQLWSAGDQVSFLFGLTNSDGSPVTIMHSPVLDLNDDQKYLTTSVKMPLYAVRQTDSEDLLSLDLWSFRLKANVSQRGGVTVLNNVINSEEGEKVVIKVNQMEKGNLSVFVMTLDGNIVDYLHRGEASEGEHFFAWDGSNRKGTPVARGMYFIRVLGPGIDETRKVLVVK